MLLRTVSQAKHVHTVLPGIESEQAHLHGCQYISGARAGKMLQPGVQVDHPVASGVT
jgi:hypothetical protein